MTTDVDAPQSDGRDITDPMMLLRLASMVKRVEDQLESLALDADAAARLGALTDDVRADLPHAVSPTLVAELDRLVPPTGSSGHASSTAEAVLVHAQLAGWIDGVMQGMQLEVAAAQLAARAAPPADAGVGRREESANAYI